MKNCLLLLLSLIMMMLLSNACGFIAAVVEDGNSETEDSNSEESDAIIISGSTENAIGFKKFSATPEKTLTTPYSVPSSAYISASTAFVPLTFPVIGTRRRHFMAGEPWLVSGADEAFEADSGDEEDLRIEVQCQVFIRGNLSFDQFRSLRSEQKIVGRNVFCFEIIGGGTITIGSPADDSERLLADEGATLFPVYLIAAVNTSVNVMAETVIPPGSVIAGLNFSQKMWCGINTIGDLPGPSVEDVNVRGGIDCGMPGARFTNVSSEDALEFSGGFSAINGVRGRIFLNYVTIWSRAKYSPAFNISALSATVTNSTFISSNGTAEGMRIGSGDLIVDFPQVDVSDSLVVALNPYNRGGSNGAVSVRYNGASLRMSRTIVAIGTGRKTHAFHLGGLTPNDNIFNTQVAVNGVTMVRLNRNPDYQETAILAAEGLPDRALFTEADQGPTSLCYTDVEGPSFTAVFSDSGRQNFQSLRIDTEVEQCAGSILQIFETLFVALPPDLP